MSFYFNSGNDSFQMALNSKIYVDKTGLIEHTNELLDTEKRFICVSRPRRFGKSMAANMLEAYYCRTCDSHSQFDKRAAAKSDTYEKHINKYDVIHVKMTDMIKDDVDVFAGLATMEEKVTGEIKAAYPNIKITETDLISVLMKVYDETNVKFVFIIDEWDGPFRIRKSDTEGQKKYVNYLMDLFKDKKYVALAYMTGILPIKKFSTESSLNMFLEYSMIHPGFTKPYFGFTQYEVKKLCDDWNRSYEDFKDWYDGYVYKEEPENLHICNSDSVVCALLNGSLRSYWPDTESYESLKQYIQQDRFGLHNVLQNLINGGRQFFQNNAPSNDIVTINSLDDILTILVHLGYLAYYDGDASVTIPNNEVRPRFIDTIRNMGSTPLSELMKESEALFAATKDKDEEEVCKHIKKIHHDHTSIRKYKDEGTLTTIVRLAYIYALSLYMVKPEAESGDGYADLILDPLSPGENRPIIIELKHNRSAEDAVAQIKRMSHIDYFRGKGYKGEILYVGINYKTSKALPRSRGVFTCKIEAEKI
ncbi:MAG: ATP-binding protein [Clostridia bacterium]|nr:ATP-binding protein [Clostridia bacterium]